MIICITGTSSGIGNAVETVAKNNRYTIIALTRSKLDLSNIESVINYDLPYCDVLINCAGHDYGGKCDFNSHDVEKWVNIMNVNLVSTMILTQKVLRKNSCATICNITSTNCDKYYPNDLVYTLTKNSLSNFTDLLQIEYPDGNFKEFRLGLTKTNFNRNRNKFSKNKIDDDVFYNQPYLKPDVVAKDIVSFLFEDSNFKRVAP